MKKYFLNLAYCGNGYFGFERQTHYKSIQGTVEDALSSLIGSEIQIKAAGRTDAGVNAEAQAIAFVCENIEDIDKFLYALNRLLPRTIEAYNMKEVPLSFDPRHSCCGKRYEYRFSFDKKMPFQENTVAYLGSRRVFNSDAFKEALSLYEGTHNFQCFTSKKVDKDGFVRTLHIETIEIDENRHTGRVVIQGNGFMTYMVRFLMGAAFKCAFNKIEPSLVKKRLEEPTRCILSYKAPAEGLTLLEVLYNEDVFHF